MRRVLITFVALVAVLLAIAASVPLWLGSALATVGSGRGLSFERYEQVGYSHFRLHGVEIRQPGLEVTAAWIEATTPVVWLLQRTFGEIDEIVVDRWSVKVTPQASQAKPEAEAEQASGWLPLRRQIVQGTDTVHSWLPRARTGEGRIVWPEGDATIRTITWSDRKLTIDALRFREKQFQIELTVPAEASETLHLAVRDLEEPHRLTVQSRGATLAGEVVVWEQRVPIEAQFAEQGWLPENASVHAGDLKIPGAPLKLGQLYSIVNLDAQLEWRQPRFNVDIAAAGNPAAQAENAPPFALELKAQGDLEAVTVETLRLNLPGLLASLSAPITVERSGEIRGTAARFSFNADLAEQPWFDAKGVIEGEARLVSGMAATPAVEFQLAARDVAAEGVAVSRIDANGNFEWPRARIESGTIVGDEGEQLQFHGGWDFEAREILDAAIEGALRGSTFARWLPEAVRFEDVTLQASAEGPVDAAKHSGSANARRVSAAGAKPLDLALTWNGTGTSIEQFSTELTAGGTQLSAAGSVDAESARLTALEFRPGGEVALQLKQPATVRWTPTLQLESLELSGNQSAIHASVSWGEAGRIAIALRDVPSAWLADFVELPGPEWRIANFALTGSWQDGPMTFATVLGAEMAVREKRPARINLDLRGDAAGMQLVALRVMEAGAPVVDATAALPVAIAPGTASLLRIDEQGKVAIDARTVEDAALWREVGELTGLTLAAPRVVAKVRGTWQRPTGEVRVSAQRIALAPKKTERDMPPIQAFELVLNGTRAGVELEQLAFTVQGQPVRASGRLPVPDENWDAVIKDPVAFVRRGGTLQLDIPSANLAEFADVLPDAITPQGRLEVHVSYADGALDGSLRLEDAATQPIGTLGALHDIGADVRFAGRTVELHLISAKLGGEGIQIRGTVELPQLEQLAAGGESDGVNPRYDVTVKANNLPFVRKMGLLVRGDLDLALTTPEEGPPRVSGSVRLRNGLFLQDVRALIPTGVRSKTTRPPYFAVEVPPFEDWALDIAVVGDEFMRLRTAPFSGTASADFRIRGTLGEPMMTGEATIDRGTVRLPFATFDVEEGRVWLTQAQPHQPQISLTATTRRYEYDLTMEITGNVSSPAVTFESTPSLERSEILLLVMAGVVPNEEVTLSTQQRATRLGSYLGRSLLSNLGSGEDTSRLSIITEGDISRQGRETYRFEYRLDDDWALTGEYDEYDTQTFGVKWQAYARGGDDRNSDSEKDGSKAGSDDAGDDGDSGEPAPIKVSGLGLLGDREMAASLRRLLGERGSRLDEHEVEDAVFLLLSALQDDGYLRPVVHLEIPADQGEIIRLSMNTDLHAVIPRGLSGRSVEMHVERGTRYTLEELEISGLQSIDAEMAREFFVRESGLLRTEAARVYTPARVQRGVASLEAELRERGFAEAQVTAGEPSIDHDTGKVALALQVTEGPRWVVEAVNPETADVASAAAFQRFVGEPWSEAVEQDIAAELRNAYLSEGYADARVRVTHTAQPADDGSKRVIVNAAVEPGPLVTLGEIRFEGRERTRESLLRRRVPSNPGEPLDVAELERARHRISRLGVFDRVKLEIEPESENVRDAVYVLQPGRRLEVNLLAGYNTYEQLRVGVEVLQYNLWGRAHQTRGLLVQSFKSSRGEYTYTVPQLFGESITGRAQLFGLQREEPAFLRQEYGARFTFDAPISRLGANGTAGYTFEVLRNRDNELETSAADDAQVEVAHVEFGLTRDRRDNPLLPRHGYRAFARTEVASPAFGGKAEYQRFEIGGSYHTSWGTGRWVHLAFAHGLVTTWGTDDSSLPVNKRFFPGGDGSNRGFNTGEAAPRSPSGRYVGAKSYASGTVELEQALAQQWSVVVFVDTLGITPRLSSYPFDSTLYSAGAGIRYQTLIGPVRFEYGHNLNRRPGDPSGTFHFSIGFPF